jgi:hypothetical protein
LRLSTKAQHQVKIMTEVYLPQMLLPVHQGPQLMSLLTEFPLVRVQGAVDVTALEVSKAAMGVPRTTTAYRRLLISPLLRQMPLPAQQSRVLATELVTPLHREERTSFQPAKTVEPQSRLFGEEMKQVISFAMLVVC